MDHSKINKQCIISFFSEKKVVIKIIKQFTRKIYFELNIYFLLRMAELNFLKLCPGKSFTTIQYLSILPQPPTLQDLWMKISLGTISLPIIPSFCSSDSECMKHYYFQGSYSNQWQLICQDKYFEMDKSKTLITCIL